MIRIGRMVVRFWLVLAVTGALLLPNAAQASCSWDWSGEWRLRQTNGYSTSFFLQQTGTELLGWGRFFKADEWAG